MMLHNLKIEADTSVNNATGNKQKRKPAIHDENIIDFLFVDQPRFYGVISF